VPLKAKDNQQRNKSNQNIVELREYCGGPSGQEHSLDRPEGTSRGDELKMRLRGVQLKFAGGPLSSQTEAIGLFADHLGDLDHHLCSTYNLFATVSKLLECCMRNDIGKHGNHTIVVITGVEAPEVAKASELLATGMFEVEAIGAEDLSASGSGHGTYRTSYQLGNKVFTNLPS
jgi:hypothetical protein